MKPRPHNPRKIHKVTNKDVNVPVCETHLYLMDYTGSCRMRFVLTEEKQKQRKRVAKLKTQKICYYCDKPEEELCAIEPFKQGKHLWVVTIDDLIEAFKNE